MSKRVLLVGMSTRALAESAVRAGYDCVTVDAFGDRDQRALVPNRALGRDRGRPWSAAAAVALAADIAADAVAYTANLGNHPAAVRRLACGRELLGNGPTVLRRVRDPWQLARAVLDSGGFAPATVAATEAARADPDRPWLRKPVRGGGGSGVAPWQPGEPVGARELLQERVDGVLASASFAADGRRAVLLGMTEQIAGDAAFGADGFRFCGSVFPLAAAVGGDERLHELLQQLVQALTERFELRGVNGIDFVLRDGEPYVLEVNPRPTASMELVERACGISVFDTHLRACRGELPAAPPAPAGVHGKAILYARRDVVIGDTDGWLDGQRVRDIPFPGDRIRRGHPICTVFACGEDADRCRTALRTAAAALETEIYG